MKRKAKKKSHFWLIVSLILALFSSLFIHIIGVQSEKSLAEWYQFDQIIVSHRHAHYAVMEVLASEIVKMDKEKQKILDKQKKSF